MSKDIIDWNDKYAAGWCRAKFVNGNGYIESINDVKDAQGGWDHPYVNTADGNTVVIKPGDKIEVDGKKVIRVVR